MFGGSLYGGVLWADHRESDLLLLLAEGAGGADALPRSAAVTLTDTLAATTADLILAAVVLLADEPAALDPPVGLAITVPLPGEVASAQDFASFLLARRLQDLTAGGTGLLLAVARGLQDVAAGTTAATVGGGVGLRSSIIANDAALFGLSAVIAEIARGDTEALRAQALVLIEQVAGADEVALSRLLLLFEQVAGGDDLLPPTVVAVAADLLSLLDTMTPGGHTNLQDVLRAAEVMARSRPLAAQVLCLVSTVAALRATMGEQTHSVTHRPGELIGD